MRKFFLVLVLACVAMMLIPNSATADIVKVNTAGTLNALLSETASEAVISGSINGTDIKYLRYLLKDKSLTSIDLSSARIVAGGEAYYESYITTDDEIGDYMFYQCATLQQIVFPQDITIIRPLAFKNCDGLASVVIPDAVETLGNECFRDCKNLNSITLGKSVKNVNWCALWGCPAKDIYAKPLTSPILSVSNLEYAKQPTIHVYSISVADYLSSRWAEKAVAVVGDLDKLLPVDKYTDEFAQLNLETVFDDAAATTLKFAYKAMSDGELESSMSRLGMPDYMVAIAKKIKNGALKSYEKDFRIHSYNVYSDAAYYRDKLKSTGGSFMGNPTGIYTKAGEKLYVFVDQEVPEDAMLYLGGCTGNELVNKKDYGTRLKKGLNIIEGAEDALYYVIYTADTQSQTKDLSSWPAIKIHVEGGTVNGYYDISRHNEADYRAILNSATHERFTVKGDHTLFNFKTESYRSFWPSSIDASIRWFDQIALWEWELIGISESVADGERASAPYNLTGGESYFPKYYNNPYFAIQGEPSDIGWANSSWYRVSFNSPECVQLSFDVSLDKFDEWCVTHETGHNNQQAINLEGCTEVSNNFFSNVMGLLGGRNMSRGLQVATTMQDYVDHKVFFERDIMSMTRMYYQLYLYYHQARKNTSFYPTLFQELRNDPIELWNGTDKSMLKFVRKVCQVANEDLSDFFRAWGFFEPFNGKIEDHGEHNISITQADIDATLAEISKYPRKNREILFIEDCIDFLPTTGPYVPAGQPRADIYNRVGVSGDMGQFTDYLTPVIPSAYEYLKLDNSLSFKGKGAVGLLFLDDKGGLLFASNNKKVTLPESLKDKTYIIYAVAADGSLHETKQVAEGVTRIEVKTPGTLPSLLPNADLCAALQLSGSLNGTDIRHLRHLICDEKLSRIDLTEARIVKGGEAYYKEFMTTDDVIGEEMFYLCTSLAEIKLPQAVIRLDTRAFRQCSNLQSIEIPASVTVVGWEAFRDCTNLAEFTLGENVTEWGATNFWGCKVKNVYVRSKTPPSISVNNNTGGALIHVLPEVLEDYLKSDWNKNGTLVGDLEPFAVSVADIVTFIASGAKAHDYNHDGLVDEKDLQWLVNRVLNKY